MASKNMKKWKEISAMSPTELSTKAAELQGQYFEAKVKHGIGQLEDTGTLWRLRKEIARVKTAITAKGKTA